MHYNQLIQKLYQVNLFGGIKLGLNNCITLNEALGSPTSCFPAIHIAGSNGKGSVTKKIATALQHAGYRVGLYTSPHISCFRERIRINDVMISEKDVEQLLSPLFFATETLRIPSTFFEITTLMAFQYFALNHVDYAVIETGLGGRLDATNIVIPILSVITSISLEHTNILGSTIEEIAKEKAGIIKPRIPVVLGPRLPLHIFSDFASSLNSPCISVKGTFNNFDEENCAIAKTALETLQVPAESITYGLNAKMPCRMEHILTDCEVILDVAHNPDGLQALFKAIKEKYPHKPIRVLFGLSKTKDIRSCLSILSQNSRHFHLVEAPNGRGLPVNDLRNAMLEQKVPTSSLSIDSTIKNSVQRAIHEACKHHQLLVICGTFFIMSEARAALGINDPHDPIDVNER